MNCTFRTIACAATHSSMAAPAPAQSRLHVDVDAPPLGDGWSWGAAFQDLQNALFNASISGGTVHEIWVAQGPYHPDSGSVSRSVTFGLLDGVTVCGGFGGTETPTRRTCTA